MVQNEALGKRGFILCLGRAESIQNGSAEKYPLPVYSIRTPALVLLLSSVTPVQEASTFGRNPGAGLLFLAVALRDGLHFYKRGLHSI
jgi:hypothetical protein